MAIAPTTKLNLPSLEERIPELISVVQGLQTHLDNPNLPPLPAWEQFYERAHTLKGLLGILACHANLADFLLLLSKSLQALCRGENQLPEAAQASQELQKLYKWLSESAWQKNVFTMECVQKKRLEQLPKAPFPPPIDEVPEHKHRWAERLRLRYSAFSGQFRCPLETLADERQRLQKTMHSICNGQAFLLYANAVLGAGGDKIFFSYAIACHSEAKARLYSTLGQSEHSLKNLE